ncbi:GNAT family N-acetyltransferase [Ruegeria arenilitoris]|uniref:GNAT family N-acetyltransferase n=1 Tax=Ruegeria arenilitoris TaxID=1173585 RepID=UPI0014819E37|nr:GNAT family N-acetyltransferase [Ruegeria arenilitoris]
MFFAPEADPEIFSVTVHYVGGSQLDFLNSQFITLTKAEAMVAQIVIRGFEKGDIDDVRSIFIEANRDIAPNDMADAFEDYIVISLQKEFDDIEGYYSDRNGGFFVAELSDRVIGMYGLETVRDGVAELRRMYLRLDSRGMGLGKKLFDHSIRTARSMGFTKLLLSTSELQLPALNLYRSYGLRETKTETAEKQSNKTIGGGIIRYHFEADL